MKEVLDETDALSITCDLIVEENIEGFIFKPDKFNCIMDFGKLTTKWNNINNIKIPFVETDLVDINADGFTIAFIDDMECKLIEKDNKRIIKCIKG